MSSEFYTDLLATATELITEFGRPITLFRDSTTSTDPARPWEGNVATGTDSQSIPALGVFFDIQRDAFTTTGAGIGRGSTATEERRSRVLVEVSSALPEELGTDWWVEDGSRRLSIIASRPQEPGPTLLYYELEVRL